MTSKKKQPIAIAKVLGKRCRIDRLLGTKPSEIITELLERLCKVEKIADEMRPRMLDAILERERQGSTGIGHGIAIPHMKECPHVAKICGAFGRSSEGVEFAAIDGGRVHLFFLLLIPTGKESEHLELMRKVVRLGRDQKTMRYLRQSESFDNLQAILEEIDEQSN